MLTDDARHQYEVRFQFFMQEIQDVAAMTPKEHYLYRIMDGVPFKDLETALLMAKIDGKTTRRGSPANKG